MAEQIEVGVNVKTGDSVTNLEEVRDVAKEAGEAVDGLDQKTATADVDVDVAGVTEAEAALDDVTAAAQTADGQTVTVTVETPGATDAVTDLGNVETKVGDVKNVSENMTGNIAGELAGIAGLSGPAAQGLGQLAEAAAGGAIPISTIAKSAGGIALAGLALEGITSTMQVLKDADAFDTARIEALTDKLLEGLEAAVALKEVLDEEKRVTVRVAGEAGLSALLPWGDSSVIEDITDEVNNMGLKVDEFTALAAGPKESIDEWARVMDDAGADADELALVVMALYQENDKLTEAAQKAAAWQKFQGDSAKDATPKVQGYADAVKNAVDALMILNGLKTGAVADTAPVSTARAGRGETVNNFYPAAPSPMELDLSAREYQRVRGPG